MLYSDHPRVHYHKAQLAEVICQFRFPAILSIGAKEPVEFQEAVRSLYLPEHRSLSRLGGLRQALRPAPGPVHPHLPARVL